MNVQFVSTNYLSKAASLKLIAGAAMIGGVAVTASAPAARAATVLVSRSSAGIQGNSPSFTPVLNADGSKAVFFSGSDNLVANDNNSAGDVFLRDLSSGTTTLVSLNSAGEQGNGSSSNGYLSADGSKVVFQSNASNLVANDTNGVLDIFVRDLSSGITRRVSVDSAGAQSNGQSYGPVISADGSKVAFASQASNLVANDTNDNFDVFVYDLNSGIITRASVSSGGVQGNDSSSISVRPELSADGSRVAFASQASNLVADDTNGFNDIFVRDLSSGVTVRGNVGNGGVQANSPSYSYSLSANGKKIAFDSGATNFVNGTNGLTNVFVRDLSSGVTTIASVDSSGDPSRNTDSSDNPSLSADGRRVAFQSLARNLVANDNNGLRDIFVRDLNSGVNVLSSVSSSGAQGIDPSESPFLSANGQKVGYFSFAANLVAGDTYGADSFVSDVDLPDNTPATPTISALANQSTHEDTPLSVAFTIADSDTAPTALSVSATSNNQTLLPNANLVLGGSGANRTLALTPVANLSGSATVTVTVSDGTSSSSDSFVLQVFAVNDAPSFTIGANQSVNNDAGPQVLAGFATNISAGPNDENAQTLALAVTNSNNALFVAQPAIAPNGTLSFTPAPGQSGSATVSVVLQDDGGVTNSGNDRSAAQTFVITVNAVAPVNQAPVAQDRSVSTNEDIYVSFGLRATDANNDALTFRIVTPPVNGTLSGSAPDIIYTSRADFNGADSFMFIANDGKVDSNLATITLQVLAVNDPPFGQNQRLSADNSRPLPIALGAIDADNDALTYAIYGQPAGGTVTGQAPNLVFHPQRNYRGGAGFTFSVSDGKVISYATISIEVSGDDAVIAKDDFYNLVLGNVGQVQGGVTLLSSGVFQIATPSVLSNDIYRPGNPRMIKATSSPRHGRFQLRSDGNLFYLPSAGFVGVDEFTYEFSDGRTKSSARVRLNVIDKGVPELRFDTPRDRATGENIGKIAGRVRDRNSGLKSLSLLWRRFDGKLWNGRAWTNAASELPLTMTGINWVYAGTAPKPGNDATTDLVSGRYDLQVTATDNSGNIARVLNRITIDAPANMSAVRLSSASASASANAIVLRFTGALNIESTLAPANYALSVNGERVNIGGSAYTNNSVTLAGFELQEGDAVELRVDGLRDESGKKLSRGTVNLVAR